MSNIKVGIKFRPAMDNEFKLRQWIVNGNQISSKNNNQKFSFANVFDESSTNRDVYSLCSPIVQKSLDGFNGTILTYGQTSSGKTFTMMGENGNKGIIEMSIDDILQTIDELNDKSFMLRIGFIEIYNEKIYDLLSKKRNEVKIFEFQGQLEMNHNEYAVKSKEEIMKYVKMGNRNKHIASTALNEFSSRSHTIFSISIDSSDSVGDTKSSKLIFGDLAGSERPDVTKNSFNEGLHINKSLLALGKIIRELSKPTVNMKYVRFRESMLTRLLASSLGGNSFTTIICTASPCSLDETFNTICFAQNAEKTKCKPTSNSINDSTREVSILKGQVQKLQKELEFERSRIFDTSIINFNSTYQVTSNTIRRTENLKRKFCVDPEESLVENHVKIFIQTDMSAIEENTEVIEDLKKQVSEFKRENDDLKAQLHDCNQNIENLASTKESLKHDLKEESHKGWKIREKCKMLRNKLMQKKEKLTSMKAKTSNLIDTHDGLDKSAYEDLKAQYELDILHKNLIIFGLEDELKRLKDLYKEAQNGKQFESTAVNTEFDLFEVKELERKNYNQQHVIHDLNTKIQDLLHTNQVLQTQLDEAKLHVTEIKKERDEFKRINNSMKNNFQESLKNTRKQFHSIVEQKQQQAADFRRQLTDFRNEELKNHLRLQEHYEKQFDALKINNKKLNTKIGLLEIELTAKNECLLQSNKNDKINLVKAKFELKLAETVKFFERILEQKEDELNEIRKLQNHQDSNNLIDRLVAVNLH